MAAATCVLSPAPDSDFSWSKAAFSDSALDTSALKPCALPPDEVISFTSGSKFSGLRARRMTWYLRDVSESS